MIYRTSKTYERKRKRRRRQTALLISALAVLLLAFSVGIVGIVMGQDLFPQVSEETLLPDDPSVIEKPQEEPTLFDQPRWLTKEVDEWYEINPDVIGWLSLPACDIDDPIVQSYDNNYYLRRTIESDEYDVWGCYFLDYINLHDNETLFDKVSIIYGHALEDVAESEKFSKLKRYKDAAVAVENPYITFSLLEKELKFQIFAVSDIPITIDYIDPNPDDAKYQATLDYLIDNSYVDMGVSVTTEDQILVLSTCTSDENVRFVVAGKLCS